MNLYAVIMAGGVGARFWPRSRERQPKQLLNIAGENTMIQDTVARLDGIIKKENIYIITNRIQKPLISEQLPGVPYENIIDEPFGKNTAACIGLASVIIEKKDPRAVTVVLPADHIIKNKEEFQNTILKSAAFANEKKGICTIGIVPVSPETGYGYIQIDEAEVKDGIYKVLTFAEKPNLETAKRFIKAGDFLWNSGIFIWRVDVIIEEIRRYMPDLFEGLKHIRTAIGTEEFEKVLVNVYGQLKSISIDYGVMEKSGKVYLAKGNFNWNDVGSWEAVYQISSKDDNNNVHDGNFYSVSSKNSLVYNPGKFTAVIGLDDILVINTDDALLVCARNNAQDVKMVVDHLKMNKKTDLL